MTGLLVALGDALKTALDMFWEVLWPLILGFGLSGIVQAVVSHKAMARLPRRRFAPQPDLRQPLRHRLQFLLLRRGRPRPLALPQGRQLHGGDGLRARLDQPGHRTGHHPGRAPGLALRGRGVRRRHHHGHPDRPDLPPDADAETRGDGEAAGGARADGAHGGARRDGHERRGRLGLVANSSAAAASPPPATSS